MIRTLILPVAAILILSSCTNPYVQSYYAIPGEGTEPLPGMQGVVVWVEGQPATASGHSIGTTKSRLLTFIFITPGAGGNGSKGGGSSSGGATATFNLTNGLPPKRVEAKVVWDKRPDVVSIDGVKYNRRTGSLFVIVKSPGSKADVWQLTPPAGKTRSEDLLAHAKKALPQVKALQAAFF